MESTRVEQLGEPCRDLYGVGGIVGAEAWYLTPVAHTTGTRVVYSGSFQRKVRYQSCTVGRHESSCQRSSAVV